VYEKMGQETLALKGFKPFRKLSYFCSKSIYGNHTRRISRKLPPL
jgi:hypothetical protein